VAEGRSQMILRGMSTCANASISQLADLSMSGIVVRGRAERRAVAELTQRIGLVGDLDAEISTLSGGNQQKVFLAKWLSTEPRVLLVDEPTRGIDVGTKAEVHRLLSQLAADGVAVLMVSSELPEVLGMADRILVMHEGRRVAYIPRATADEETVMTAATGEQL
jgi:rhamnose transport system ATP-binding protein